MILRADPATTFAGPNIWSRHPLTLYRVRSDWDEQRDRRLFEETAARVGDTLPTLVDRWSPADPLPPADLITGQGWTGLLASLALNLQRLSGIPAEFVDVRPLAEPEQWQIALQHRDQQIGRLAVWFSQRWLDHLVNGYEPEFDIHHEFTVVLDPLVESHRPGQGSRPILEAARARDIPVSRVDRPGRCIELGNGAWRKRILGCLTSRTGELAEMIVDDKWLTRTYLIAAGLPVSQGADVTSLEQALAAANAIGYPVVLKPVDFAASIGVRVNLRDEDEVRAAYPEAAVSPSGRVIVERHVNGLTYRAFVVDGQLKSVVWRETAFVTGDGRSSIRELIEDVNNLPRCGPGPPFPARPIAFDEATEQALTNQELDLDSVLEPGSKISVKPEANFQGFVSHDVTDVVHADNRAILVQAAMVVGLDIAAIDLIAPDISQSIWSHGGAILELNANSYMNMHAWPAFGEGNNPGAAIVEMLFPPGASVRAPIVALMGDGSDLLARSLADLIGESGRCAGLVTSEGLVLGGTRMTGVDPTGPAGARTLLDNPATEVLVVVVDPRELHDQGLGFDYCDLAVVSSLSGLQTPFGEPVETVVTRLLSQHGSLLASADRPELAQLDASVARFATFHSLEDLLPKVLERSFLQPSFRPTTR